MTVTEIALLHILPAHKISDQSIFSDLAHAIQVLRKASGYSFYLYQQIEDPHFLYILGTWQSVSYHRDIFLPSPENQSLLSLVKDRISVEWMFHVSNTNLSDITTDAQVIAIERHFINAGERQQFQNMFEENTHHLPEEVKPDSLTGGRR